MERLPQARERPERVWQRRKIYAVGKIQLLNTRECLNPGWQRRQPSAVQIQLPQARQSDDRAVYCSCQKQTSYTFRGYVLKRDVTKFQGYTLLAV